MISNGMFAEIAALAGDPARASMLQALMGGRALTAGELANAAGITPQTASGHLARMTIAGLITFMKQGRHRYHRLASPSVALMMESIMQVACDVQCPQNAWWLVPETRRCALRESVTTILPASLASPWPMHSSQRAMRIYRTRSASSPKAAWHFSAGAASM